MRVTLRWLAEFVDIPNDVNAVADRLESLGHEVEAIEPLEVHFTGVVVGRVTEIAPHPDADKIRVCQVDIGGSVSEIICGAWNFDVGAVVPVAVPGAVLPGGFEITARKIRGVTSHGMICSGAELALSDDSEGILVLDDDYEVGRPFAEQLPLPDHVLDVAITPNRPDCMSVVGLARELAASYELPLRDVVPAIDNDQDAPLTVRLDDPDACPRYVARQVDGVTAGESPLWLQMRLRAAGVRPISNLVDATNYVLLELGHPTHAFDTARLGDTIVVRRPTDGERMTTLDGQERSLAASDLVIADADRAIALAGLMGGADTEVDEATTSVTIEAAYFDAPTVMLMSKRIGLRSEASARFERGMDPNLARRAADRVAELLVELGGGTVGGIVDAYPRPIEPRVVSLPPAEIPRVLGVDFDAPTVIEYLGRLGFTVEAGADLAVEVPTRRPDVTRPIDLVEEIARLHGYDEFPDRVAFGTGGGIGVEERRLRRLREVLVGAGYHEAMTFSFIGEPDLDRLGLPSDDVRREGIEVINPLHSEEGVMRTTLLPGLLKAASYNVARKTTDVALFEVGKTFMATGEVIPDQPDVAAFLTVGGEMDSWHGGGRPFDVFDAVGTWELLAEAMRLENVVLEQAAIPPFHPERGAHIVHGGLIIGTVGEIHPSVAGRFDLQGRVTAAEVRLESVLADPGLWTFTVPSPYPPVIFDLAFEVPDDSSTRALLDAVRSGEYVENAAVFDVFRGGSVAAGHRSIAVRLTLRAPDRTLTDEEVAPIRQAIVDDVVSATGAQLRGTL